MSNSQELENLKACQEAAQALKKAMEYNQTVTDYNTEQNKKQGVAHKAWENRKKEHGDAQTSWDNRKDEHTRQKQGERLETRNGGCVSYDWWCRNDYGGGWEDAGEKPHWGCDKKRYCKKTAGQINNEATAAVISERGARPADFNEPEPKQNQGEFVYKEYNPSKHTVSCCSNITNVVASDLNDSNIQQECNQSIETKITQLEDAAKEAAAKAAANAVVPASSSTTMESTPAPVKTTNSASSEEEESSESDYTMYMYIGIGILMLFILSSIGYALSN